MSLGDPVLWSWDVLGGRVAEEWIDWGLIGGSAVASWATANRWNAEGGSNGRGDDLGQARSAGVRGAAHN